MYVCRGYRHTSAFSDMFRARIWQEVPNGLVVPSWIEISHESSATLTCGSITPVIWFSVHYSNQSKTVTENTLTLHNLQGEHSGPYVCRGTINDHNLSIFHSF